MAGVASAARSLRQARQHSEINFNQDAAWVAHHKPLLNTAMQKQFVIETVPSTPMKGAGHRLTIALVSICVALVTLLEPASPRHRVVEGIGDLGWMFTYLTTLMSVAAILDVVVNDLMADQYVWWRALRYRMYAYMLQAMMHMSMAVSILTADGTPWAASISVVLALSCVWVAVSDTYYRYIAPRQKTDAA